MRQAVAGSYVARCGIGRELREAAGAGASRIQAGGPALSPMGEASYPSLRGYIVTSAGCANSAPKTSDFTKQGSLGDRHRDARDFRSRTKPATGSSLPVLSKSSSLSHDEPDDCFGLGGVCPSLPQRAGAASSGAPGITLSPPPRAPELATHVLAETPARVVWTPHGRARRPPRTRGGSEVHTPLG